MSLTPQVLEYKICMDIVLNTKLQLVPGDPIMWKCTSQLIFSSKEREEPGTVNVHDLAYLFCYITSTLTNLH